MDELADVSISVFQLTALLMEEFLAVSFRLMNDIRKLHLLSAEYVLEVSQFLLPVCWYIHLLSVRRDVPEVFTIARSTS